MFEEEYKQANFPDLKNCSKCGGKAQAIFYSIDSKYRVFCTNKFCKFSLNWFYDSYKLAADAWNAENE